MLKSKGFQNLPVISITEGDQIGKIKELVVNPATKEIAALIIEQKGWFKEQKFIPYNKVYSVGEDAITIEQSSSVQKSVSLPDFVRLTKDKHVIIGSRVVAENGTVLGAVEEFYVEATTGAISGVEIVGSMLNGFISGKAFLEINFVRTIGKDLVVVSNDSIDNLIQVDSGLKGKIKGLRSVSSNLWDSTKVKAKEVSQNLNKKLDEMKAEKAPVSTEPDELPEAITPEDPVVPEKAEPPEPPDNEASPLANESEAQTPIVPENLTTEEITLEKKEEVKP